MGKDSCEKKCSGIDPISIRGYFGIMPMRKIDRDMINSHLEKDLCFTCIRKIRESLPEILPVRSDILSHGEEDEIDQQLPCFIQKYIRELRRKMIADLIA